MQHLKGQRELQEGEKIIVDRYLDDNDKDFLKKKVEDEPEKLREIEADEEDERFRSGPREESTAEQMIGEYQERQRWRDKEDEVLQENLEKARKGIRSALRGMARICPRKKKKRFWKR